MLPRGAHILEAIVHRTVSVKIVPHIGPLNRIVLATVGPSVARRSEEGIFRRPQLFQEGAKRIEGSVAPVTRADDVHTCEREEQREATDTAREQAHGRNQLRHRKALQFP